MIKKINISNIAIIDNLEINFSKGFNIITGESGSGKSILIKSIEYLKGKKFNKNDFRKNASSASVSSVIKLDNKDYSLERRISKNYVSSFYVNNEKTNFDTYSQLLKNAIDIHNQNDHQDLLDKELHIQYLDAFSDNSLLLNQIDTVYTEWQKMKKELSSLIKRKEEYKIKKELYQFQNEELSKIEFNEDMEEKLMSKYQLLFNSKKIKDCISHTKANLNDDLSDNNISAKISNAIKNIEDIVDYSKSYKTISLRLESLLIEANDISFDLENLSNNIVFDIEKLKKYEEKIAFLNHIKSKYGPTIKDVINHKESLKNKIVKSKNYDKEISNYESKIEILDNKLMNLCKKISLIRKKMQPIIEREIKQKFVSLDLKSAEIQFNIKSDNSFLSISGYDKCEIFIRTNKGEDFKPLTYIASGGEISRIMLAIKLSLQDKFNLNSLIFDEVDVGISGSTASKIGSALYELSKYSQVVCVTHLPQIASKTNDSHYKIFKTDSNNRIIAKIKELDTKSKINEIARLLSNEEITSDSIKQATNMMGQ
ncbi:DNA repair protein RecN [bacterium]|nr:MAG: DNA repair protein RecN [bacterium]